MKNIIFALALILTGLPVGMASAHEVTAEKGNAKIADFDIVLADVKAMPNWLEFNMDVSGKAGSSMPSETGKLAGSSVFSYVWPTKIDSATVGFEKDQGILALAVTAHPDFDDTPLFDENGDGNQDNDGNLWHAHWVVLVSDDQCGKGALKVKDIDDGSKPKLPATWPGLPILIDSPGYTPIFDKGSVKVRVPFRNAEELRGVAFDGVTAGLRVSESMHAPLLCVVDVKDIASGNLSLPGKVE